MTPLYHALLCGFHHLTVGRRRQGTVTHVPSGKLTYVYWATISWEKADEGETVSWYCVIVHKWLKLVSRIFICQRERSNILGNVWKMEYVSGPTDYFSNYCSRCCFAPLVALVLASFECEKTLRGWVVQFDAASIDDLGLSFFGYRTESHENEVWGRSSVRDWFCGWYPHVFCLFVTIGYWTDEVYVNQNIRTPMVFYSLVLEDRFPVLYLIRYSFMIFCTELYRVQPRRIYLQRIYLYDSLA